MATHDFSTSLSYEQSKFSVQDRFYTERLGAKAISRADFSNDVGKNLQRKDVDVQFVYQGRQINVSEKNRTKDYGDLLLEVYSKFPDTPGWMDKSDADFLAYFVPRKVYWINKRELEHFYHKILDIVNPDTMFAQMKSRYPRNSRRDGRIFVINGRQEKVGFMQAYNHPINSNDEWYTESISISFNCLKRAGVHIEEFAL